MTTNVIDYLKARWVHRDSLDAKLQENRPNTHGVVRARLNAMLQQIKRETIKALGIDMPWVRVSVGLDERDPEGKESLVIRIEIKEEDLRKHFRAEAELVYIAKKCQEQGIDIGSVLEAYTKRGEA